MPDFDVNDGYIEAARRRADSPLPGAPDEQATPAPAEHPLEWYLPWIADGEGLVADAFLAPPEYAQPEYAPGEPDPASLERKLPEETPVVRRARQRSRGHLAPPGRPARRVGVKEIARRRIVARRACPCGWQVRVLSVPPGKRRRLWTTCH